MSHRVEESLPGSGKPETRSIKPGIVAEIEVVGAVQTSVSEFQPDRLIHADAIAAHDAPQKRSDLIHPRSVLAGLPTGLSRYDERQGPATGPIHTSRRRTTDRNRSFPRTRPSRI